MSEIKKLGEVITALVTPFQKSSLSKISWKDLEKVSHYLLENGSDALLISGSTGEGPQLSDAERRQLITFMRKKTPKGTKIIVSTGSNNTKTTKLKTLQAKDLGADAVLISVPEYIKPPQRDIIRHFDTVAKSVPDMPIIIYNIPSRTGAEILPETAAQLARDNPNIVGIKQSMGNMDKVSEMKNLCPPYFQIYSGDDSLTLPMLSLGAKGVVSVASHLEGNLIKEMIADFKTGQITEAARIHQLLFPLFKMLSMTTNPIPVKEALFRRKMISSPALRTLGRMDLQEQTKMKKILSQFDTNKSDFIRQKYDSKERD